MTWKWKPTGENCRWLGSVGSLGTKYKCIEYTDLHIRFSKWSGKRNADRCSLWSAVLVWQYHGRQNKHEQVLFWPCHFYTHEKEVLHRLRKWTAGSRTLLENSQKNPRTLNTMHKLLLSRTLSWTGVARVSSSSKTASLSLLLAEWLNTVCLGPEMAIGREWLLACDSYC